MIEKYDGPLTPGAKPYEVTHDELTEDKPSAFIPCEYQIDKYDGDITEALTRWQARKERWGRAVRPRGKYLRGVRSRLAYALERSADTAKAEWRTERGPVETVTGGGNLLMYGGASNLWQCLIGNGTATDDQTLTYFDNGDAALGVGDSSTAAAATQTDLQAATNKSRVAMDATYPTHTDGTSSGSATITFRSTFTGANYAWNEWGLFNSPDAATGRMLNRKTFSGGTKASGTWVFTVTCTLA